jgi:hypothetical protein
MSTDSKILQSLTSPRFNFAGKIAAKLEFYERRTSTHNSGLLVAASVDSDTAFTIQIGDTLKNSGATSYLLRSLQLPPSLNDQTDVRFRWRVVGNGTGATGTLRIDNVAVTVQKVIDLALTGLQSSVVRSGENLSVRVDVANRALAGIRSFQLQLFDDKNFDSLAASAEKIDEQMIVRSFAIAESTTFTLNYPTIPPGNHRLIVKLLLAGDEDTTNNAASKEIFAGYAARSILVNEIMYAPAGGPEWVECINNSADTISLSQWEIGDNTASRSTITSHTIWIVPRQFFIISKDSSITDYFSGINVPVIKSSFAALNNDADAVVIADPTGFAVDSVAYNSFWGGTNGKSLERIDTSSASNQPSNWGSSRHPENGTPGAINSLTRKEFDLSVEKIFLSTAPPVLNQQFEIAAVVKNIGRQAIARSTVRFFLDKNNDSIPQSGEIVDERILATLLPADSQTVICSLTVAQQGQQRIFVSVETQRDDDSLNDGKAFSFIVGVQPGSIVINEIMYAPTGDMPEWIEFYNAGDAAVDVGSWKISDSNTKSKSSVPEPHFIIQPDSYFLFTTDSSLQSYYSLPVPVFVAPFSALNNTTPDAVVLFDSRGGMMDSVWYTPTWGGANGKSLERVDCFSSSVDSANWESSLPTPGVENSVAKKDFDLTITNGSVRLSGNGLRLTSTVLNVGRNVVKGFSVRFYHDANGDSVASARELLQSVDIAALAPSDSILSQFDWQTNVKGKISIICRVEFSGDERTSNNTLFLMGSNRFQPQSVVINEIMYEPLSGHSEFIELFNRSADTVDVQTWRIMDAPSSSGNRAVIQFPNTTSPLLPNQFLVVTADSTLLSEFSFLGTSSNGKIIIGNKDLSLNNSGDEVVLVDQTNTQIDSVRYSPSWHNPSPSASTVGKSLERVNPSFESNDRRNWSTSVSPAGATPMQRNSIFTTAIPSAASLQLSPNPFSPDNDGFEDFLAISYSLPSTTSMIRVRCFDVQGRLVRIIANNEPAASTGTLLWNGLDDNNQRVRIGMYIVLLEALDAAGGVVRTMKDVAVVATKL